MCESLQKNDIDDTLAENALDFIYEAVCKINSYRERTEEKHNLKYAILHLHAGI